MKGDANPWELNPDPSFIVVKSGFDLPQSIVLTNFVERVAHILRGIDDDCSIVEIEVLFLGLIVGVDFFFLHELLETL